MLRAGKSMVICSRNACKVFPQPFDSIEDYTLIAVASTLQQLSAASHVAPIPKYFQSIMLYGKQALHD